MLSLFFSLVYLLWFGFLASFMVQLTDIVGWGVVEKTELMATQNDRRAAKTV